MNDETVSGLEQRRRELAQEMAECQKRIRELEMEVEEEKRVVALQQSLEVAKDNRAELVMQAEAIEQAENEEELVAILGLEKVEEIKRNVEIAERERIRDLAEKAFAQMKQEVAEEQAKPGYIKPTKSEFEEKRRILGQRIRDKWFGSRE